MWCAEITERSVLSALNGIDASFRASRVDDEALSPVEKNALPAIVISADGGSPQGYLSIFYTVGLTVTITTSIVDDPKRTQLASLEDSVRTVLDGDMADTFNAIGAQYNWYFKGITDCVGGLVELLDNKQQSVSVEMIFRLCKG